MPNYYDTDATQKRIVQNLHEEGGKLNEGNMELLEKMKLYEDDVTSLQLELKKVKKILSVQRENFISKAHKCEKKRQLSQEEQEPILER